jgi:hypothetical protein
VDRQEATFSGISALVPAHITVVTPERATPRRYWDFDPGRRLRLGSMEEFAEALHERFEAARRRTRAARPLLCR